MTFGFGNQCSTKLNYFPLHTFFMLKYFTEIKNRFFLVLITYFFSITTIYCHKEIILLAVIQSKNLYGTKNTAYFIFTDVTEIFSLYMQLIFFISSHIISFYILYNIFIFLTPALFKKEYETLKFIFKLFCFAWIFSALISVKILIPLTWNFFLSFQDSILLKTSLDIYFEAKIIEYFNFFMYFYLISTLYFQLSIFLFGTFSYFNISLQNIKKFRKVYYFSFVLSTAFLCPDILSQLIIICILLVGYETFVLLFLLFKNTSADKTYFNK